MASKYAEASSRGWITTLIEPGRYGKVWLLTTAGAAALEWFHTETPQ